MSDIIWKKITITALNLQNLHPIVHCIIHSRYHRALTHMQRYMYARDVNKEKVARGRGIGSANGTGGGRGKRGSSPSSNFLPLLGKLRTTGREGKKSCGRRWYKRGLMQLVLRERERSDVLWYIGGYRGIKVPLRQTRSRFSTSAYVTANES